MQFSIVVAVLCVLSLTANAINPKATTGVVEDSHGSLRVVELESQFDEPLLAWGGYQDTIDLDGWAYLSISTNQSHANAKQVWIDMS